MATQACSTAEHYARLPTLLENRRFLTPRAFLRMRDLWDCWVERTWTYRSAIRGAPGSDIQFVSSRQGAPVRHFEDAAHVQGGKRRAPLRRWLSLGRIHTMGDDSVALTSRLATRDDLPVLLPLIDAAIDELQKGFLGDAQIRSSHAIMGIDTQLIDDGTYFVVELDGQMAGCGGWSRRATLYGGDHSTGRDAALLDPAGQPAKIRAMYTHPAYARRGVGRLVLARCEAAAAAEGFGSLELMATMAGR